MILTAFAHEMRDWLDLRIIALFLQEAVSEQDPEIRDQILEAGVGRTGAPR